MMDEDGYPTDETLEKIENWDYKDTLGLMGFIKPIWYFGDWGWQELDNTKALGYMEFHISTGGWSGNEDIISAMYKNMLFWSTCWESMKRGGHYEFRIKEVK